MLLLILISVSYSNFVLLYWFIVFKKFKKKKNILWSVLFPSPYVLYSLNLQIVNKSFRFIGKLQFQETFNVLDHFGLQNLGYSLCQINSLKDVLRCLFHFKYFFLPRHFDLSPISFSILLFIRGLFPQLGMPLQRPQYYSPLFYL